MKNTKLIQLVGTFSKSELSDFERYLNGLRLQKGNPIFNLFKLVKKEHPGFRDTISKEQVYDKVFGKEKGKKRNMRRLTDLLSDLNLIAQNYLINKKMEEDEAMRALTLMKIYEERKLDKLFFFTGQKLINKWEKNPLPGREYFQFMYDIYSMYCYHPNYTASNRKEINLGTLANSCDTNFIVNKLYITNNLESSLQVFNYQGEMNAQNLFIDDILTVTGKAPFSDIPYIFILRELILSRRNNDYSNYSKLKETFLAAIDHFNQNESYDLILSLQGYCYQNYHKEGMSIIEEIHFLNKIGLERNIFPLGEHLPNPKFLDIMRIGCALKDFEWVEWFIETYISKIEENKRQDVLQLSKAILYSKQDKYEKALQELIHAKPQDIMFDVQIRMIRLQCYYELEGYEETLDNYLNALSSFISRNKLLAQNFKSKIKNLIRFTYKLSEERQNPNQTDKAKLLEKLHAYSEISLKSWLIEKVNAIHH